MTAGLASVALSLGSNQGSSEDLLRHAVASLSRFLEDLRVASLYRSAPLSPIPQDDYLNTAVTARSPLGAEELLGLCKALEWHGGRRPGRRLGPRPLDVDLLLFDALVVETPALTLPHPALRSRRFVLAPLAEIAPELPVPPDGTPVEELLTRAGDEGTVRRVAWRRPPDRLGR